MKIRKILAALSLCVLTVLAIGGISVNAASKKVKLSLSTKEYKLDYVPITASISLKAEDIVKVEFKEGKIKKTADKYWDESISKDFSYNKETGKTESVFNAYFNRTYSVRVTTKSGKKYVNSIKLNNVVVRSEHCEQIKSITKISKPNSTGNYTITVDFKYPLNEGRWMFEGTYTGDTINLEEGDVVIQDFMRIDENGEVKHQDEWDDSVVCIVVLAKNPADYFDLEVYDYLKESPEYALFAFLPGDYESEYVAYANYENWDSGEYMVPFYRTIYSGVKFKVTKKTRVKLAYSEEGAPEVLTGKEYFDILTGRAEEMEGVHIYKGLDYYLYEDYNDNDGFTDVVKYMTEIYVP